jgi:hypothetical protein
MLHGIDHDFVAHSFRLFRDLNRHFPFVDIPAHLDVSYMIMNRPLLTVAICGSASSARPEAQDRLTQAFGHALSSKVFISGEKSMDIMLGLLVHIAWSHYTLSHARLYQNLHLLAAMAADQGLYGFDQSIVDEEGQTALERHRAFIGSYYLCANLAEFGLAKPNPMSWTDNLHSRARNVARSGSLPFDPLMPYILSIAHAVDDFHQDIRLATVIPSQQQVTIPLHSLAATKRLDAIRRDYPAIVTTFPGFLTASLQIHHRALRSSSRSSSSSAQILAEPRTIIPLATTIKTYLDALLSSPASTPHHLPITEWAGLLDTLVLMTRLSPLIMERPPGHVPVSSRDASSSTAAAAAATISSSLLQPTNTTLEALCAKMTSAPREVRHDGLVRSLVKFCEVLRRRGEILPRGGSSTAAAAAASSYAFLPQHHHQQQQQQHHQHHQPPPPPRPKSRRDGDDDGHVPSILLNLSGGILDEALWEMILR